MDIERDTIVEAIAAMIPPALSIAALYLIGQTYSSAEGISPTGAQAVVGVIVAFILLVTVVGLFRARSS
jgi:hypothetical protein